MKNQRKFAAIGPFTVALVTAMIIVGAALSAAQTDSAHTRYQQTTIRSKPPAPIFKTLVTFTGTNGINPGLAPIQGTDGNLYGGVGGGKYGQGLLFKMTPSGTLTPLYDFCEQSGCPDGEGGGPEVLGSDGNFYGSTGAGGASGYGTIFKFTAAGTLTTLHSFDEKDGFPIKHLVQGSGGILYGTASNGGNLSECFGIGCGNVFKITTTGTLTTLYDFCSKSGCDDGAVLYDALKQGPDGNYYGTTWAGGAGNGGTIFQITPTTGTLTTLYSFCVINYPFCGDGSNPIALVLASDGNFYGTTAYGGGNGEGSVYQITPSGTLTTIYSSCTQIACTDGATPRDGLVLGSDGNFYGATYYGGTYDQGILYEISPAGALTTLHSFDGTDGRYPIQHLFQATNGIFYGSTDNDGSSGDGTIFSLSVGLVACVETAPISGKVGARVIILGNKLKGSTKVTFNGTSAVFKVVSSTEITTTVPTGATTGEIQVTTPSGTLISNVSFQVP